MEGNPVDKKPAAAAPGACDDVDHQTTTTTTTIASSSSTSNEAYPTLHSNEAMMMVLPTGVRVIRHWRHSEREPRNRDTPSASEHSAMTSSMSTTTTTATATTATATADVDEELAKYELGKYYAIIRRFFLELDRHKMNTSAGTNMDSCVSVPRMDQENKEDDSAIHSVLIQCPLMTVSHKEGIHACDKSGVSVTDTQQDKHVSVIDGHNHNATATAAAAAATATATATTNGAGHNMTISETNDSSSKYALSLFTPVAYDPASDTSLILCHPITGRTHQLRLHLQCLGCPIANDVCYGGELFYQEQGSKREAALEAYSMYLEKGFHKTTHSLAIPHIHTLASDISPLPSVPTKLATPSNTTSTTTTTTTTTTTNNNNNNMTVIAVASGSGDVYEYEEHSNGMDGSCDLKPHKRRKSDDNMVIHMDEAKLYHHSSECGCGCQGILSACISKDNGQNSTILPPLNLTSIHVTDHAIDGSSMHKSPPAAITAPNTYDNSVPIPIRIPILNGNNINYNKDVLNGFLKYIGYGRADNVSEGSGNNCSSRDEDRGHSASDPNGGSSSVHAGSMKAIDSVGVDGFTGCTGVGVGVGDGNSHNGKQETGSGSGSVQETEEEHIIRTCR